MEIVLRVKNWFEVGLGLGLSLNRSGGVVNVMSPSVIEMCV